jgi:hypothetical protein
MLRKITLALSAAFVLGAVSTASAAFDPWLVTTDAYLAMHGNGSQAFAATDAPRSFVPSDPRDDASRW